MKVLRFLVPLAVLLFSVFPLTDTDIWWHLACAREWVVTWTPVRPNIINGHEYFQTVVGFVYGLGGAPLLVAFKALLWASVFALFLWPLKNWRPAVAVSLVVVLFCLRYQFEIRPAVFSMLFLGIYWNLLPRLFKWHGARRIVAVLAVLLLQWVWCRFQGLYILGPVFAGVCVACRFAFAERSRRALLWQVSFVMALFAVPFLHGNGLALFMYPFGLLDRLLGLSESAAVFASGIAENRSPVTVALAGENVVACFVAVMSAVGALVVAGYRLYRYFVRNLDDVTERNAVSTVWLCITAVLALVAERNIVLFLPVFCYAAFSLEGLPLCKSACRVPCRAVLVAVLFAVLGLWCRSLVPYGTSMVSEQRVPVAASEWMKSHPHAGRLFNDDRAGGYLAFVNPQDSTYLDGRFFLKTAEFFERYLHYSEDPSGYMRDMDSLGVDRAVFPLRYYARWDAVVTALSTSEKWHRAYVDSGFVVLDRNYLR